MERWGGRGRELRKAKQTNERTNKKKKKKAEKKDEASGSFSRNPGAKRCVNAALLNSCPISAVWTSAA